LNVTLQGMPEGRLRKPKYRGTRTGSTRQQVEKDLSRLGEPNGTPE